MSPTIFPSHALIARADTTIADCIAKMQQSKVSSLLIMDDQAPGGLIGIFTERDLLNKVLAIQEGSQWNFPIRTVMTPKVHTVELSDMDQAPEMMLTHEIRHLPVTMYDAETDKKVILGVISMRDLFRVIYQHTTKAEEFHGPLQLSRKIRPIVVLISEDQNFIPTFEKTLRFFFSADVRRADFRYEFVGPCQILIVDLDGLNQNEWSLFLRAKNTESGLKMILVVFSPELQPAGVVEALELIGTSEKFWIMKKPLDLINLYERVSTLAPVADIKTIAAPKVESN